MWSVYFYSSLDEVYFMSCLMEISPPPSWAFFHQAKSWRSPFPFCKEHQKRGNVWSLPSDKRLNRAYQHLCTAVICCYDAFNTTDNNEIVDVQITSAHACKQHLRMAFLQNHNSQFFLQFVFLIPFFPFFFTSKSQNPMVLVGRTVSLVWLCECVLMRLNTTESKKNEYNCKNPKKFKKG